MSLLNNIQKGKRQSPPRLLIYGIEGVGKSTLAANAPDPIFIPTEDGLDGTLKYYQRELQWNKQRFCSISCSKMLENPMFDRQNLAKMKKTQSKRKFVVRGGNGHVSESQQMVVIRSIVSRNRFTILLRDPNGQSRLVFDGYISQNPNGWIAFTTTPPLDESRLTITAWQHWRLLGCLKIKRFLKKCFRRVSLWWVGRPRYATGRDTARLSRSSRLVG